MTIRSARDKVYPEGKRSESHTGDLIVLVALRRTRTPQGYLLREVPGCATDRGT
jgi:hypothetical protein